MVKKNEAENRAKQIPEKRQVRLYNRRLFVKSAHLKLSFSECQSRIRGCAG